MLAYHNDLKIKDEAISKRSGILEDDRRLLTLDQVVSFTGYNVSSIYYKMNKGTFPKSIKLGGRKVAWLAKDVEKWLDERIIYGNPTLGESIK